ncbi:hypothetical protein ASG90_12860 [Nocardioides sp. Soil797]|nr:hypothetical protein ASG90_12860 [Nocardioides sp. Soil797]
MKPLTKYAVPLVAAGLIALTGCSAGGSDGSGDSSSADRQGATADMMTETQPPDEAAPSEAAGGGSDSDSTQKNETPGANRTAPQTRAVISTGTISLSSDDTEKARFDLQKVIDAHHGTIADENGSTDDDGNLRRVRIVLRVPIGEFDKAMTELGEVADLTSSSRSSEDVTTQVIDNKVRIRAQEKSLRRIEALLARAQDLSDIVSIESQLSSRQADLDSLKSQQAYLQDQTSLSTITVHLEHDEAVVEKKKDDGHNAFVAGLLGGWSALAVLGAGTAQFVGALLPFAVLLLVIGIPLAILVRRMRPRRISPDT